MMIFEYPKEQRRINKKVIEALMELDIEFDRSYGFYERWINYPHEKYVFEDILFYVGALPKIRNARKEKEDVPSPDIQLVNKIFSHFWNSGDPDLQKVAYNTFFDLGSNGLIPSFPLPPNWLKDDGTKDDPFSFSSNRSEPFFSSRLTFSPMNMERWKEIGEGLYEEEYLFFGFDKAGFAIMKDGIAVGRIVLYPIALAYETVYGLYVHIKEEYRGNGYGKEAVDALTKRVDEGKVVLYSPRDYIMLYEEYPLSPSLIRAYADIEDIAGMRMMDGTLYEKEGIILAKEDSGYRKKASYHHLVRRK